ncbi:hypothetical protein NQ314_006332 [Rhamnusium bicolor]|uniref:Protein HIRA n=1 Tax=Rhamnusium bicolor TaxID=1586634 RepID=A0AAV8Z4P9_9CUCU|nr:hypothetical protein NQ314_006332 [Rhamnusium bicolor]
MIFLKPAWINHEDDKPIFSVDIHPKGGRFATGGQGGSGGRIVVWNIGPVINENEEADPKIPKMLCQMDNHLACVNVVRWSNAGHLLASGGDDKLVMIWRLTNEGSSSIFGSGKVNVETWKCVHTLNSHNGDILDIAWAPHDGWLASGSVDNTVIIWNAHKFPEKVAVLKSHTGMVKGVTWDPVGKYIASQSDDKSLRIWRTSDWAQQEVVTDPFVECSATTHVLRLSWSPDGQYLVSAHAMNGGGPTAQIIEREGWRQDKDFRFNSNILKKQTPGGPKMTQYCCCAIGSRDRSISVWLTSLKRPLVVIKDLFDDSVLDISWSSNGLYLLACSWDGTVACVTFTQEEIGTPLSMDEKVMDMNWNLSFSGTQIVENPELLSAIDEINEKNNAPVVNKPDIQEPQPVIKDVSFESPKLNQSILVPANKQLETRLPSGKRRITPMLLTSLLLYSSQSGKEVSKIVVQPPGIQINQLMCSEVPGDEPIVKFINILDPLKMPPGVTVTNNCHKTTKGSLSKIEVYKNINDKDPKWDTYLASVNGCSLSTSNNPIISLTDGRAYSYSMDLQTWVQLSNPLDPVSGTGGRLTRRVPSNLPLASLQRSMPMHRNLDTLPPGVTLSFLESQITATSVLESVSEYRHWLIATVNHLLDKGPE